MKRSIALAALVAVSAPYAAFPQCSEADKQALIALDKAWGDAGPRGDRAFLETVYAPNFVGHNPGGTVDRATTIANTMRTFETNRANPQPMTVPDHYMVTCTATTATITHRNVTPPAAGTTGGPTYSRSVHFLEKRGNRWQVVSTTAHTLSDEAVLAYLELDWNAAAMAKDHTWLEKNYAGYATDVGSQSGAMESKVAAIESMKSRKWLTQSLDLSDLSIRVNGDAAVVTGINHAKGREADGKPIDRRVRFTDTFIKQDGRWMVWATQGTTIR